MDSFLRTLEGLGHVDVRRDESLQPVGWEANPAYLAETPARGFALLGVWSSRSRRALGKALDTVGGSLECESDPDTVSTWFARGISTDALTELVNQAGLEVYVIPDAVGRMLAALPPLSALEAALPEVAVPTYNKAAIFNLADAAWRVTPGVGAPGAYRLEQSFRTRTIWVDEAGAVSRRARVGTVQLVKHLAARAAGQPLDRLAATHARPWSCPSAPTFPDCTAGQRCCARAARLSHRVPVALSDTPTCPGGQPRL